MATVLILVKAYPAIGKKSGESVCVAGLRVDLQHPEWIRLFPVGFRQLPPEKQFHKYQFVRLRVRRGRTDRRPESFQPDLDSLVVGTQVGTERSWQRRVELLAPIAGITTTCALQRAAATKGQEQPSLGMIRPRTVEDLIVADNPYYRPDRPAVTDVDLFGTETEVLEATPFVVKYVYRCEEPDCSGHEQTLVDWESGMFARHSLMKHDRLVAKQRQREKFLGELCGADKDTWFFVGNQHQHPGSFLVLGVFWPPRIHRQETLLPGW